MRLLITIKIVIIINIYIIIINNYKNGASP